MHSSRMRTVRNSSRLPGGVPARGVVYLPGGCTCWGGTCPGVYLPGGVPARGWGYLPREVYLLGVPAGGGGTCPGGVPAGGWGYLPREVYLLEGTCLGGCTCWGCTLPRGRGTYPVGGCTYSRGVYLPRECVPGRWYRPGGCTGPTDRCTNINLRNFVADGNKQKLTWFSDTVY